VIGDRIRSARQKEGMTQEFLAHILGVSRTTVGLYETHRSWPSLDVVIVLCEHLRISADWLLELPAPGSPPNLVDDLVAENKRLRQRIAAAKAALVETVEVEEKRP
jgi:DNA-binding XRE family transcriptional regulator